MGTIIERKRATKGTRYTAQVRIKRGGKIVHRENETFSSRKTAQAWIDKREKALSKPGVLEAAIKAPHGDGGDVTLWKAIDRYIQTSRREIGKTKAQVLATIKSYDIAEKDCGSITSHDIVAFAEELLGEVLPNGKKRSPQTVGNYMSHLSSVFAIARPAWDYPLDYQAMKDAQAVMKRLGLTSKSKQRVRRPTLDELDLLMNHFLQRQRRAPQSNPMHRIIAFALYSTRRQEEIVRIRWADFDKEGKRVLVRDMKNPGEKIGNDQWCELPDEAVAIVEAMPRTDEGRIFPYNTDAISAAFTRARQLLGIEDLRFHDLRHDGVSRQFEMGKSIPQAAAVSGHRSWSSLKGYTHLRQVGDKYEGWKWLPVVTEPVTKTGEASAT